MMPLSPGGAHVFLFVLTLMLATVGCTGKRESVQPALEDISESAYASGIVKSRNQYQVFASVSGVIKEMYVKEGDLVRKGQPIMKLLDTSSKLAEENARLTASYAGLSANTDKLNALRLEIDLARIRRSNDSLLMIRQDNLRRQNIGTQVEWEQRQLAFLNSKTAYEGAVLQFHDLERQLKFNARQSMKNLEITQSQAGDFIVISELDGKVYQLLKRVGEMATIQTPVAVLGEVDHFILEMEVDEFDISKIFPGQRVVLTMDSYPAEIFEARVDIIDPMMNERTKTFTVEAVFDKRPVRLFPNLTAEANIIIQSKKKALTIPRIFLFNDSMVMIKGGQWRKVKIGIRDYQKVEILNGLSENDEIVKAEP